MTFFDSDTIDVMIERGTMIWILRMAVWGCLYYFHISIEANQKELLFLIHTVYFTNYCLDTQMSCLQVLKKSDYLLFFYQNGRSIVMVWNKRKKTNSLLNNIGKERTYWAKLIRVTMKTSGGNGIVVGGIAFCWCCVYNHVNLINSTVFIIFIEMN